MSFKATGTNEAASVGEARVDWAGVDWVLLDMDGTVLDLAYDNYFWRVLVHERFAQRHGLTLEAAAAALKPHFESTAHTLPWYCTDHWSRVTGLDMAALKAEIRHRIRPLPGAVAFLEAVQASGRRLWLATNAHPDSWRLKLEHTGLGGYFERIICSHDYGAPKEDARFWTALQAQHPFEPARSLFVDDSRPVLDAARAYGIGQVIGLRHPDSSAPERELPGHLTASRLAALNPPGPA